MDAEGEKYKARLEQHKEALEQLSAFAMRMRITYGSTRVTARLSDLVDRERHALNQLDIAVTHMHYYTTSGEAWLKQELGL